MHFKQQRNSAKMALSRKLMANLNDKNNSNAPGRYYVDTSCVDCDQCRFNAADFFRRDDEIGLSIVYRQPQTPEEIEAAEDALNSCPSPSIGNDGDAPTDITVSAKRSHDRC
jgi:ferredoxin